MIPTDLDEVLSTLQSIAERLIRLQATVDHIAESRGLRCTDCPATTLAPSAFDLFRTELDAELDAIIARKGTDLG